VLHNILVLNLIHCR